MLNFLFHLSLNNMEITVTLNGSLEEITMALNAIKERKERDETIISLPSIPVELPKKKRASTKKRAVEIHIGSIDS